MHIPNLLPFGQNVVDVLHSLLRDARDVQQALAFGANVNESSKVQNGGNGACWGVAAFLIA